MDPRATKLAEILVNHSVNVTKGSNVVIDASDFTAKDLIHECYRLCLEKGANVYLDIFGTNYEIGRADYGGFMNTFLKTATAEQLSLKREIMEKKIEWGDKFIRIVCNHNKSFLTQADNDKMAAMRKGYDEPFRKMINKDWVLTYFPTYGRAQDAKMSLEEYTDYYYNACIVDYKEQGKTIQKLQDILDKGSVVTIKGENVDLKLGVKGRLAAGAITGDRNIPDGECFVGPQEDVTEGYIKFEYPQSRGGNEVVGAWFKFEKGSVIEYGADQGYDYLKSILEDHPGHKRLGELGIGMNPMITTYMKDILFDEKIMGTIHFAFGHSYDFERGGGKNGGNIHWDMIKDLRHKGSLVTVDDTPIIKDGKVLV